MPLGFFAPVSHFSIVLSLVFKYSAKTGWLTLFSARIRTISAGLKSGALIRWRESKSRMVALSIAPTFLSAEADE